MKKRLSCIIDYLSSLTFTIIVISGMALTAAINICLEDSSYSSAKLEADGSHALDTLIDFFGLLDLNHSWWFRTLLILFTLNLLICVLRRIPKTLAGLRFSGKLNPGTTPAPLSFNETIEIETVDPNFAGKLESFLMKKLSRPAVARTEKTSIFFSQKGRYSFLGFYFSHLGLLLILIGAIISGSGREGHIYLKEGQAINKFRHGDRKSKKQGLHDLNLSIRLDRLNVLNGNKGEGKNSFFTTTLTLFDNDKKLKTAVLEGHQTLKYNDVRISQSYLGKVEQRVSFSATPKKGDGQARVFSVDHFDSITIPETGHTIRVAGIMFPKEQLEKLSTAPLPSPDLKKDLPVAVVTLEVFGENGDLLYTPFLCMPEKDVTPLFNKDREQWEKEYKLSLLDVEEIKPQYYADLKISYEPGANLIWMSLYITIIGFSMMFLLSHRKLWVKVEKKDGGYLLTLGGWASRNPGVIKDSFKDIRGFAQRQVVP